MCFKSLAIIFVRHGKRKPNIVETTWLGTGKPESAAALPYDLCMFYNVISLSLKILISQMGIICFIRLFCELNEIMIKNDLTQKVWPLKQLIGS